jgi:hypothetical protein
MSQEAISAKYSDSSGKPWTYTLVDKARGLAQLAPDPPYRGTSRTVDIGLHLYHHTVGAINEEHGLTAVPSVENSHALTALLKIAPLHSMRAAVARFRKNEIGERSMARSREYASGSYMRREHEERAQLLSDESLEARFAQELANPEVIAARRTNFPYEDPKMAFSAVRGQGLIPALLAHPQAFGYSQAAECVPAFDW